jgi:4-hydroxy-tetrahydrodipicolinate synthase
MQLRLQAVHDRAGAFRGRPPSREPPLHLSGSITALATPFTGRRRTRSRRLARLLQAQLDGGTQGVVVAGSTGEAAALSDDEYDTPAAQRGGGGRGRMPVLAGTGQSNTAKTIWPPAAPPRWAPMPRWW